MQANQREENHQAKTWARYIQQSHYMTKPEGPPSMSRDASTNY